MHSILIKYRQISFGHGWTNFFIKNKSQLDLGYLDRPKQKEGTKKPYAKFFVSSPYSFVVFSFGNT